LRGRISVLGWVHIVALVCALVATLVSFSVRKSNPRVSDVASTETNSSYGQSTLAKSPLPASDPISATRPMYPYSVIPGGVESAQELKYAVFHDPVVAGHYGDFDLTKARIVHLDRERAVYVSYRLGDRVFWTKKTLKLFKGETLISDGVHEARTRCGNRVSDTPAGPVSPQEPSPTAMATPQPPVLYAANQPPPGFPVSSPLPPGPGAPPGGPPGGGVIPPPIYPIGGGGPPPRHPTTPTPPTPPGPPAPPTPPGPPAPPTPPGPPSGPTPPPPPVTVPEPSTSALFAIGLVVLLTASLIPWARKKRKG
jgi:hypothetical protein